MKQARDMGYQTICTRLDELNGSDFESADKFYLTLGHTITNQCRELGISTAPLEETWDQRSSANTNLARFFKREVLHKTSSGWVWGVDAVEPLFLAPFGGQFFSLLRSWYYSRALDPRRPWSRLTMVLAYRGGTFIWTSREDYLRAAEGDDDPFYIGTRMGLGFLNAAEVAELNRRYGSPLPAQPEIECFMRLTGGQPFLSQFCLKQLAWHSIKLEQLKNTAARDEGPVAEHLQCVLKSLATWLKFMPEMIQTIQAMLHDEPSANVPPSHFYCLRENGVVVGDSPREARFSCEIYAQYLRRHLRRT